MKRLPPLPSLLVALLSLALASSAFAQEEEPAAKKPPAAAPAGKSKLDEEEEAAPPKKPAATDAKPAGGAKKPPAEEEEEGAPRQSPPAKPAAGGLPTKEDEAGDANEEPEKVCDVVYVDSRAIRLKLLAFPLVYPVPKGEGLKELVLRRLVSNEEGILVMRIEAKQLTAPPRYYEQNMLELAAEKLGLKPAQLAAPGIAVALPADAAVAAVNKAERLLATAIAEHDSAVQQNKRRGATWQAACRQPLLEALFNLRLGKIDRLVARGEVAAAEAAADVLLADRKRDNLDPTLVRARFERLYLPRGKEALAAGDYQTARDALGQLTQRFVLDEGPLAKQFREQLVSMAVDLAAQAGKLPNEQAVQALALLDQAELIWPELPEIDETRARLGRDYPILVCAYATLPAHYSPFLARSPVERHAGSLLFEGLVRWSDDPQAGPHYESDLADGRPVSIPRGRQFQLQPSRWSDWSEDKPYVCTVEDVRWTVKLMHDAKVPGHVPAWAKLVDQQVGAAENDPFLAEIRLARDHWQPLSLMDFPILPKHAFPNGGTLEETARFDQQPVGTGPYCLAAREPDLVRFTANPHYRAPDKPLIREVQFRRLDPIQAVNEFLQGKVHMIYGLGPEQVTQLRNQNKRVKTLRAHGVHYLAPNYGEAGRKRPLANADLRMAIANAIDREEILNQYFRPAKAGGDHAALNGPYPKGCWAYNPAAQQFSVEKAKPLLAKARDSLETIPELRLVYPAGDAATENACKRIAAQLGAPGLDLKINLEAVAPELFRKHVLEERDFDLVYWRHDYEDESYWLWPTFDPAGQAKGGANFMNCHADGELSAMFRDCNAHKQFGEIQGLTFKIHDHIARSAPLIPLWQLDAYVAVSDALAKQPLDPVSLFGDVEEWQLTTGGGR